MGQLHIYEGTLRELTPYLAQHPNRRFRLIELEDEAEDTSAPSNFMQPEERIAPVKSLSLKLTSPIYAVEGDRQPKIVVLSKEEAIQANLPAIARLQEKIDEAANATPEEIAQAEIEWQELQDALNAARYLVSTETTYP